MRRTLAAAGLTLLACTGSDLDLSRTRTTDGGHFTVSVLPGREPIPLHEIHGWTLTVTRPSGEPVEGASLVVDGGMPEHQHGLPTVPAVTADLGGGEYRLEGMKFSMRGHWTLTIDVSAGGVEDDVTFDLLLP